MSLPLSVLDRYPEYEAVIGIEVHVQLLTNTKIFCACPNAICTEPNSHVCQICCGYPGVLPVLNKEVVNKAIKTGLGTNCTINQFNEFARKHYFYADLPKGYQITQSDHPICSNGYVTIKDLQGNNKNIRIERIHMEEDAGKNTHAGAFASLVDLNRAGTPLLEIVTKPDISNSHEARAYLKELHAIVVELGVCSGNMEEGAFRGDANVSVRKKGATKLGTKCELKNINSFKFISDAVDYEIERQINELESGGVIRQQTRLWNTKEKKTYVMREKETADDYRYFADPDVPPLFIDSDWIESVRKVLPELPQQKKERFIKQFNLTEYEASVLVDDKDAAWYYEEVITKQSSKSAISLIIRDIMGAAKEAKMGLKEFDFCPKRCAELVMLLDKKMIAPKNVADIIAGCMKENAMPHEYAKKHNLLLAALSEEQIKTIIKNIITSNDAQAREYKLGKVKLLGFFMGKIMQETKGAGDSEFIKKYFETSINELS